MNAMKIFKIIGVIILSGGLFTAGYFWGQYKMHNKWDRQPAEAVRWAICRE